MILCQEVQVLVNNKRLYFLNSNLIIKLIKSELLKIKWRLRIHSRFSNFFSQVDHICFHQIKLSFYNVLHFSWTNFTNVLQDSTKCSLDTTIEQLIKMKIFSLKIARLWGMLRLSSKLLGQAKISRVKKSIILKELHLFLDLFFVRIFWKD